MCPHWPVGSLRQDTEACLEGPVETVLPGAHQLRLLCGVRLNLAGAALFPGHQAGFSSLPLLQVCTGVPRPTPDFQSLHNWRAARALSLG